MIDEVVTMIDGVEVILEVIKTTAEEVKKWDGENDLTIRYRSSAGNEKIEKCSIEWDGERAVVEWNNERVGWVLPGKGGGGINNMQAVLSMTLKLDDIISIQHGFEASDMDRFNYIYLNGRHGKVYG